MRRSLLLLTIITIFSIKNSQAKEFKDSLLSLYTFSNPFLSKKYDQQFQDFIHVNQLKNSESNQKTYYQLVFYHDLFTCNGAWNGARGGILKSPYLWHWVTPNPRHSIKSTQTGELIKSQQPPQGFKNYASFADIDRTPYLYFKDLLTPKPQYTTAGLGDFYTFGWCSEREMAHVQLMTIMGYPTGKVIVKGNHSWSEYVIPFESIDGENQMIHFKIDNTFDGIESTAYSNAKVSQWKANLPIGKLPKWYQAKAENKRIQESIRQLTIPENRMKTIKEQIISYYLPDQ